MAANPSNQSGQSFTDSSMSDLNMTTQSLTMSPKLASYGTDYTNYNFHNNSDSNHMNHISNGRIGHNGHPSKREINNNYSNPPAHLNGTTLKSRDYQSARNKRGSDGAVGLSRSKTDPRGGHKKKNKRSKKEQKKWKKKMKEIGKNHPEFELSYDLLLGIRTSTSTVNSSIIRSSVNPTEDDSSDDDELSIITSTESILAH